VGPGSQAFFRGLDPRGQVGASFEGSEGGTGMLREPSPVAGMGVYRRRRGGVARIRCCPGWDAVEEDEKSDGGAVALAQLLSNLVGEQAAG